MSVAQTREHVASPTAESEIPAADLPDRQISTPDDSDSDKPIESTTPQSRKDKRRQTQHKRTLALLTPPDTDTDVPSPPTKPPNKPPRCDTETSLSTSITPSMPPAAAAKNALQTAYPLLICSIGNPGATYANTLHSAGHIVTSYLSARKDYQPFTKGLSGLVSKPDTRTQTFSMLRGYRRVEGDAPPAEDDWTFWQSTTLMNVSGASVKKAYTEWLKSVRAASGSAATQGRLVVVHDELEGALGKVAVRDGGASAKGHNGLKSCQQHLGGVKWWRIGVGIGRPESRDPNVVSRYVLGKMTAAQRSALEKSAVGVFGALEDIAAGKR